MQMVELFSNLDGFDRVFTMRLAREIFFFLGGGGREKKNKTDKFIKISFRVKYFARLESTTRAPVQRKHENRCTESPGHTIAAPNSGCDDYGPM